MLRFLTKVLLIALTYAESVSLSTVVYAQDFETTGMAVESTNNTFMNTISNVFGQAISFLGDVASNIIIPILDWVNSGQASESADQGLGLFTQYLENFGAWLVDISESVTEGQAVVIVLSLVIIAILTIQFLHRFLQRPFGLDIGLDRLIYRPVKNRFFIGNWPNYEPLFDCEAIEIDLGGRNKKLETLYPSKQGVYIINHGNRAEIVGVNTVFSIAGPENHELTNSIIAFTDMYSGRTEMNSQAENGKSALNFLQFLNPLFYLRLLNSRHDYGLKKLPNVKPGKLVKCSNQQWHEFVSAFDKVETLETKSESNTMTDVPVVTSTETNEEE